jgi:integrase
MYAYIVLSILIGARTEELRALTWEHVDLEGNLTANPPIPPPIMVWRSVRAGGDTKTRQSRRTLALPVPLCRGFGVRPRLPGPPEERSRSEMA